MHKFGGNNVDSIHTSVLGFHKSFYRNAQWTDISFSVLVSMVLELNPEHTLARALGHTLERALGEEGVESREGQPCASYIYIPDFGIL